MARSFFELGPNEECACASGLDYGVCCKPKQFRFGRDDDGQIIKSIRMNDEALEIVEEAKDAYIGLYGRNARDEDLLFSFYTHPADRGLATRVRILREGGMPEDALYAYYRSDGLLPVEGHEDVLPDADLDEFTSLRGEYLDLTAEPDDPSKPNVVWFVAAGNGFLRDLNSDHSTKLSMVLSDFMNRHSGGRSFTDFATTSPVEYCLFSAFKTARTLEGIGALAKEAMPEGIYALSRGLYENYLYLNAIATDSTFFDRRILPRADAENFVFAEKPDGRIDYRRVVHRETGESRHVGVTTAELVRLTSVQADREIYEVFYQTACQFVHVDVLSAPSYFSNSDPFEELEPALLAQLVAIALVVLVLDRISTVDGIDEQFKVDVRHFLTTLCEPLVAGFELANADPATRNDVYEIFKSRIHGVV